MFMFGCGSARRQRRTFFKCTLALSQPVSNQLTSYSTPPSSISTSRYRTWLWLKFKFGRREGVFFLSARSDHSSTHQSSLALLQMTPYPAPSTSIFHFPIIEHPDPTREYECEFHLPGSLRTPTNISNTNTKLHYASLSALKTSALPFTLSLSK